MINLATIKKPNFTEGQEELFQLGFIAKGQDGHLGHMYAHPDGREARLTGSMFGGVLIEIRGGQ